MPKVINSIAERDFGDADATRFYETIVKITLSRCIFVENKSNNTAIHTSGTKGLVSMNISYIKAAVFNRLNLAVIIGLIATIVTTMAVNLTVFANDCDVIRDNTLRLHILANSNSAEDQQLKLAVRDRIVAKSADLFPQAKDITAVRAIAEADLPQIEALAREVIEEKGYSYPVKAELCQMYFNTRSYDGVTLPAGDYLALRVTIGAASGKNWWCVLYPSLCLPAATTSIDNMDELTPEQRDILSQSDKYEVRFATVELFEKIKQLFRSNTDLD